MTKTVSRRLRDCCRDTGLQGKVGNYKRENHKMETYMDDKDNTDSVP